MFYWWVLWVDEANINQIRWHTSSSNSQRCKYDFMFRILRGLRSFFLQNKHQAVFGTHQRLMLGMRRDVRMEWETNRKNSEVTKSSWFLRVPGHSVHVTPQLLSPSHGSYISCWKSFCTRDFYPFEKTESLGRQSAAASRSLYSCEPAVASKSWEAQGHAEASELRISQKLDTKSWTQIRFLRRSTTSEYFCTSRSAFQTPNFQTNVRLVWAEHKDYLSFQEIPDNAVGNRPQKCVLRMPTPAPTCCSWDDTRIHFGPVPYSKSYSVHSALHRYHDSQNHPKPRPSQTLQGSFLQQFSDAYRGLRSQPQSEMTVFAWQCSKEFMCQMTSRVRHWSWLEWTLALCSRALPIFLRHVTRITGVPEATTNHSDL